MSDLVAKLRIEANAAPAIANVVQFGGSLDKVRGQATAAGRGMEEAGAGARKLEDRFKGAQGAAALLGGALGYLGVRELIKSMNDAAQVSKGFEIGLGAVAGGAAGARAEMGFVRQEALDMGISVRGATESFLSLSGATNGTALAGQQTREIWVGVTQAGLAMGRSNEEVKRGLEAVSQIASKGVVSMEEIRQQLAEAIPGATNIAARAMGMTTAEFNKMVASGKLLSSDFLPKFAAQLKTEFGPAVDKYLNSDIGRARVEIGKLQTDLFDLQAIGGQAFLGGVVAGLSDLHRELTDQETREGARMLGRELGEMAGLGAKGVGLLASNADKVTIALAALVGLRGGAALAALGAEALAASEGVGVLAAVTAALGGPVAIIAALVGGAAAAGLALWGTSAASAAADAQQLGDHVSTLEATLAENAKAGNLAAAGVDAFGIQSNGAQALVEALTGKVGKLADEMYRVAAANKTMAINKLMVDVALAQADLGKAEKSGGRQILNFGAMVGGMGAWEPDLSQTKAMQDPNVARTKAAIAAGQAQIKLLNDTPLTDPRWNPPAVKDSPLAPTAKKGKADKAGDMAKDLAADVVALNAQREALKMGGLALDEWKIKDVGRQAVERSGLANKPKLTAAETALAGSIRASAEETERLKLANDRVEKSIGLQRSAEQDTKALIARSMAAVAGEKAMEDLQVKEAGLVAMRQLGIETLDQLTGADRREAEAAIASAEAKERQTLATAKTEQVQATIRNIDKQIASELARTAAVQGVTRAEVEYSKQEFIRQKIEADGKNLTADQVAQLRAKAEALYAAIQAGQKADFTKSQADELRLMGLTRRERELDVKARERAKQLLIDDLSLTEEKALVMGRILALQDTSNEAAAQAVSQLGDAVRDEFIKSGHLGFDNVADYATQKLREAVYDALLKEPIDIAIRAVVSDVMGLAGLTGGGSAGAAGSGGAGGALGFAGMAQSLTNSSGRMSFAATNLATKLGASAGVTSLAGSVGAASPYAVVGNIISSALGIKGYKNGLVQGIGDAVASTIGMAVGGPIGAIVATIGAHLLGGLLNGKPSNNGAVATLTGDSFELSGNKRNDQTSQMATLASQGILQGEQMLKSAGIKLAATVTSIDIGTRDATDIVLSDGRKLTSAVGDAAAAAEAGLKGVLEGATYVDDTQKQLVESLVAAGKGFDDIAAALGQLTAAQAIPKAIADAIQQLADPKGYDIGQLTIAQGARRQQVTEAAAVANWSPTQVAALNDQLTRLEGLELDKVVKQYAGAIDDATARLKRSTDLQANIREGFLKILDPVQYQMVSGAREIGDAIDAMKAEAQALIDSGNLGPEVLGQLDSLKDLQLSKLADQVAKTADTFADTRKSLRQWLDQLSTSPSSELSPAAQRTQALADYQRVLRQAQGGDLDARGQITSYADRLTTADRASTDNAQVRLALANQIRADIEGLAAASSPSSATSFAQQIQQLNIPLAQLVMTGQRTANDNASIAASLSPSLSVSMANLPSLQAAYAEVMTPQTDRVVEALSKVEAAIAALAAAHGQGSAAVQEAVDALVNTTAAGLAAVETASLSGADAIAELRKDNTLFRALGGTRAAA